MKIVSTLLLALVVGLHPEAGWCEPAPSNRTVVKHIKNNELVELKQYVSQRRISDLPPAEQANLLAAAVETRSHDALAVLLDAGLGVNQELPFHVNGEFVRLTPLINAISGRSDVRTVELLVSRGADINTPSEGLVPLNFALSMGQYAVADYLLNLGASTKETDAMAGMTPLMDLAVSWPTVNDPLAISLFKKLVARKVDINARSKTGASALSLAVTSGKFELVRLLLEHHANPKVVNGKGETMLSVARRKGREDIAALLMQAGARQ